MKILIAEDDPFSRRFLERTLVKWGYEVVLAGGEQGAGALVAGDNRAGVSNDNGLDHAQGQDGALQRLEGVILQLARVVGGRVQVRDWVVWVKHAGCLVNGSKEDSHNAFESL